MRALQEPPLVLLPPLESLLGLAGFDAQAVS
jgi:hypothetical protein